MEIENRNGIGHFLDTGDHETNEVTTENETEQTDEQLTNIDSTMIILQNGDIGYPCDGCEKVFPKRHLMTKHKKIHSTERPFKCHMCEKTFRRNDVLMVHIRSHTGT